MHRTTLKPRRPWRVAAFALGVAMLMSACGGGGGGGETPPQAGADPTAVPSSALASTQAMTSYIGTLAADDTQEPLTLGSAMPPLSETDEPVPL